MVNCKKCGKPKRILNQKRIIGRGGVYSKKNNPKKNKPKKDPCKNCSSDGDCGDCEKCDLLDNTCVPAGSTTLQCLPPDLLKCIIYRYFELGELYTNGWNKIIPELLGDYHSSELPPIKFLIPYYAHGMNRIVRSDTVKIVKQKLADYTNKDEIVGIGPLIINYKSYHNNIDENFRIGKKDEQITFENLLLETYKNINKLDPSRTDDNNGLESFNQSNTPGKYYIEFDNG
jgi:hypothetical protein